MDLVAVRVLWRGSWTTAPSDVGATTDLMAGDLAAGLRARNPDAKEGRNSFAILGVDAMGAVTTSTGATSSTAD